MMKEYGQNSGRQSRSFQNHCKQLITVRDRDYVLLHTHSFVPQLFSVWSSDNVKQGSPLSLSLVQRESLFLIFFFSLELNLLISAIPSVLSGLEWISFHLGVIFFSFYFTFNFCYFIYFIFGVVDLKIQNVNFLKFIFS